MESFIIPGVLLLLLVILFFSSQWFDNLEYVGIVIGFFFILFVIVSPITYLKSCRDVDGLILFHRTQVAQYVVSEQADTVTISHPEPSLLITAKNISLIDFNEDLRFNRYMDDLPVLGWMYCRAPDTLKYVIVK